MAGVKRDMQSLRALKQEGHDIIDDLVKKGWSKSSVYRMLAERLEVSERSAHFYNIFTVREAQRAVEKLEQLREYLIAERKRKRIERHRIALEMKKRHAEAQPSVPKRTWLQRLLAWIGL